MSDEPNITNSRNSLTNWHELRESSLAAMTATERERYDAAAVEADVAMDLAQLVYDARIKAGLSQAELASQVGANQATISQIEEGGGVNTTLATLTRIARATGQALQVNVPPAVPR
ncbi:helix-turn-helix domain-containing protein [Nocardioides sp. NPDC057764]|uniref:helix-turn-helix domain-containing protein n=1 Tax=Nocardioides sp. NPDC057764 TaxID=3346243 RepID=UPI00367271BF